MSPALEGKTVIIVVPSQGTAPSIDAPLGAGGRLDAGELRRNLMQTGGTNFEPAREGGPQQHPHHPHHHHISEPNAYPYTPPTIPPAQGGVGNQGDVQIHPTGPNVGADNALQTIRPKPVQVEPEAVKEPKKDASAEGNAPRLKEKSEAPEKALPTEKNINLKEEKAPTDPKATLSPTEKVSTGVDHKVEPAMPDRSTPIGDLLRPDRIRDLIAGTRNISANHHTSAKEASQNTPNTAPFQDPSARYETRPDTQRIIQQVIVAETVTHRATPLTLEPRTANSFQIAPSQNTQTATAMSDLRTSTLDKLTQMKSAFENTVERATPHLVTEQTRASTVSPQPAGIFSYVEPVRHQASPTLSVQAEDRTASSPNESRSRSEKGNVILDGLAHITKKVANIETLRALDRSFENACLAMFAAAALGVMATDRVLRELLALAREAEQRLRDEAPNEESETGELAVMQDAARQLEDELAAKKNAEAGLVGDITGVVADATIGRPLGGVKIDAGPLGIFETNAWGEFHIKNIPLGTEFRLIPSLLGYTFDPGVIFSAVGVANYFNITGLRDE